jgi:hypothetical protein
VTHSDDKPLTSSAPDHGYRARKLYTQNLSKPLYKILCLASCVSVAFPEATGTLDVGQHSRDISNQGTQGLHPHKEVLIHKHMTVLLVHLHSIHCVICFQFQTSGEDLNSALISFYSCFTKGMSPKQEPRNTNLTASCS